MPKPAKACRMESGAPHPVTRFVAGSATIALALAATACTSSGDDNHHAANARLAIKAKLKDPSSAEFDGLFVVRQPVNIESNVELSATCGYVNARNGFGGMTGPVRFVVKHTLYLEPHSFNNTFVAIEDPNDRRATVRSSGTDKPATIFEELFWNASCVDEFNPPSYSADRG